MADNAEHFYLNRNQSSEPGDNARSQASSSIQDDYPAERRHSRRESPPISEPSNAPSSDRGDQTSISNVSPELLAQITERIKKEVVEHLKQTGTIDSTNDQLKSEPTQNAPANGTTNSSTPLPSQAAPTSPSPRQGPRKATVESPPQSPTREEQQNGLKEKPNVRFTNPRGPADKDSAKSARPAAYRTYSSLELSTIDQKWGMLFDHDRNPTPRLGQFLRGLANHIIEEFQPQKSIVITPNKMATYYANHSLEREVYPLLSIFKSNSNEYISRLYRDLGCQHHLVQDDPYKAPVIPGLTPAGFAHWMTTWILAYPDQEASRLEKVVLAMPIDADGAIVDGKPERLPKQISRHLLPSRELSDAKRSLSEAISDFMDELGMAKRKQSTNNNPPLARRHSSTQGHPQPQPRTRPVEVHQTTRPIDIPQPKTNAGIERDRKPYSGKPSDATSFESESSVKIERERQPYSALPGNGKVYDNVGVPLAEGRDRANSASRVSRNSDAVRNERHGRTQSAASATSFVPNSRPGAARRPPSPPIQKFSHSTPLNLGLDGGSSYIPPNVGSPNQQFNPLSTTYIPSSYSSATKVPPPPPLDHRERDAERDWERELDRAGEYGRDREWEHERERERERGSRDKHEELRRRELRRSTIDDTPRHPIDINSPRDAEKWDRIKEERQHDDSRAAESRYDARREGSIPNEEYYLSNGRAGSYENGQYHQRHH